jgi:hypothetical protein
VGDQGEQHDQESGNPDEESGGELWGLDFFFVHTSGYAFGNSCKGRNRKHIQPTHVCLINILNPKPGLSEGT